MKKNGFTLIELLVALAASAVVLALTIPVGIRFLQNQELDSAASDIYINLIQARSGAQNQKNNSSFGAKFFPEWYVLFRGDSYATRVPSEDVTIPLPTGIAVSGIDEVTFAKRSANPSATGTLVITNGINIKTIVINESGKIEKQ